jgi:RHS repeat-associated protein
VVVKGWIYKDALKPIAETDADGNVVSLFIYGTSALSPDYMVKDGVTYRFIRDVQGSVRRVVNAATGAVAQRLDYDSFGRVLADTTPGFQTFGFQSGLYDPDTGLVQFGARWFDAATGRWLSKDPILLAGGLNLYAFCGNDPVNFVDPWGLHVVYLIDTDAVRGAGHAASAVGSDQAGWTFYSFGASGDRGEPLQMGAQDNYTVRHYRTYTELREDNPRYDGTIFYQTSEEVDMAARREGNSHYNERYWFVGHNCDCQRALKTSQ